MWDEYANKGIGICLEFEVDNLDILFPIDYIKKDTIDFTELITQSLNTPDRGMEYNDPMALLPFVIKNPNNGRLNSALEKEVRILYSPFDKEECNNGIVAPNIKTNIGHKGINVKYSDINLYLRRITVGNKCEDSIINEMQSYSKSNGIQVLFLD